MPPTPAEGSRCVFLLAALVLAALAPPAAAQGGGTTLAREELWFDTLDVKDARVYEDVVLHVNKTLQVHAGASLELRSVELVFHDDELLVGLVTAGANGSTPASKLSLVSTPKGSTYIHHARPDAHGYLFSTSGELVVQGTKDLPVIVRDVRGQTGGATEEQFLPLFTDGMQIIGGPNTIDHLFFAASQAGIGIGSQGPTRISNLSMTHVGIGIYFHFANDTTIRDSVISAARTAVYANGAENVTILDSKLWGFHFGALATRSEIDFVGVEFLGGYTGATVHNGGLYEFVSSEFTGYKKAGLALFQDLGKDGSGAPAVLVRDSVFQGNHTGENGIYAESGERVLVWNNTIEDHAGSGISVIFGGQVDLQSNTVTHNGRYGVEILLAPFRESDTRFGETGDDANREGALVGSAPVNFRVLNATGAPVENATVVVSGGALDEPLNITTDALGIVHPLLELLRIENDGTRTEHTYSVLAQKAGVGDAVLTVAPYSAGAPSFDIVIAAAPVPDPVSGTKTGTDDVAAGGLLMALAAAVVAATFLRSKPRS